MYQKVVVSRIKDNKRYNHGHIHVSGSLSNNGHQPLAIEIDCHLSSETSDEDDSESISSSISEQALLHCTSHTYTTSLSDPPLLTNNMRPQVTISRCVLNNNSPNNRYKNTNPLSVPPPSPIMHFDGIDSFTTALTIVPSEHELNSSLETVRGNLCTIRKMSDSERARKYTSSSSDLTMRPTNHLLIPPQTPTDRRVSTTNTNTNTLAVPSLPSQSALRSEREDKVSTWSYAYSYASNDIDEKTMDTSLSAIHIPRPALKNEIQLKLQPIQISETNRDIQRSSLYTGFVSETNPIEIDKAIMGPMLMYQTYVKKYTKKRKQLVYSSQFALPIQSITLNIDIAGETAFIEMNIVFINNSETQINNALFVLPTINGTVTNISVSIDQTLGEDGNIPTRSIDTVLVDSNLFNKANPIYDNIFDESLDDYICDLFRFPISCIGSHDSIKICSKWHQTLAFNEGRYHLNVPLQFGDNILPDNVSLCHIIHINIKLNSFFGSSIKFGSNSHTLIMRKTLHDSKQIHLYAESFEDCIESKDIHIAYYYADCDDITGTVFIDKKDNDNGNFILYINPITDDKHMNKSDCFGRDIIFLLDRSASMKGSSYVAAIEALQNALDHMSSVCNNTDKFGIVCFNETQIYFNGVAESDESSIIPPKYPLFEANEEYIENAKQFIANCGPGGGTDIITPLKWALHVLNDLYQDKRARSNTVKSIPFIILITDGSDYQEKQMIKDIHSLYKHVRVLTFGIGMHCNHYFLRLLSLKSSGWSDSAICGSNIKKRIQSLISKCYAPILKDLYIEDDISNDKDIQLYLQPNGYIKDIFLNGTPIIIYGEYRNNKLPQILAQTNNIIRISGICINGEAKLYEFKVNYNNNYFSIPLNKICLKQQLNQLSSLFWFNEELSLKNKIVDLSIKGNLSSEYTLMACFECNGTDIRTYKQIRDNVNIIGVTNKLFGNPDIDHNLSKLVGCNAQFITDDLNEIHTSGIVCCCCL